MLLLGCGGEGGGGAEDETGEHEPPVDELAPCDMPKLFEERCGGAICHSDGDSTAAGLDLTSPGVEDRVSGAAGSGCAGVLADPANPEGSLLYTKVVEAPTCGTQMPLNGDPLTEDELTCMRDWISGLLPPPEGCEGCVCEPGVTQSCYSGPPETADVGVCRSGTHTCQTSGMGWSECEGEVGPQGEDCFTDDVDEDCDGEMPACSEVWSRGFGDELTQVTRSVALDAEGNVYAFGDFEGIVSYGGDPLIAEGSKADLVVSKHDKYGNPLWSLRVGDSSNQYGAKMAIDADGNLILVARIYGSVDFGGGPRSSKGAGDILVAKLDGEGQHIWSRAFGDKDPERTERVVIDGQGDVLLTGTFTTTIDFGGGALTSAGMRDAFVAELDGETGEQVFSLQIGGPGDDYGFGIDLDGVGNIVIGGRFQDTIEIGAQQLSSNGDKDIYLAKLNPSGEPMWSRAFGGVGTDELHDVRVQTTGDIVVVGGMSETVDFGGGNLVSEGLRDIFVATFDGAGNHVWSSRHGDANDQFSPMWELNAWLTLALEPSGTIHIGGSLIGEVAFGGPALESKSMNPDAWHVRLAPDGSYISGGRYGQTGSDLVVDMAVSESGHVILGGRTQSTKMDFGEAGALDTRGGGDGFIAKLPPG